MAGKAGRGSGLPLDGTLEDLREGLLELSRRPSDVDLDFFLLLGFFLMLLELLEDFAFLLLFLRLLIFLNTFLASPMVTSDQILP